nr:NADP-linked glucose-6-phosphate dehydrogenase [Acetobacter hansenii, Peptide Partial, 10 aa] [Novacetimonas hansenii]
AHLPPVDTFD